MVCTASSKLDTSSLDRDGFRDFGFGFQPKMAWLVLTHWSYGSFLKNIRPNTTGPSQNLIFQTPNRMMFHWSIVLGQLLPKSWYLGIKCELTKGAIPFTTATPRFCRQLPRTSPKQGHRTSKVTYFGLVMPQFTMYGLGLGILHKRATSVTS